MRVFGFEPFLEARKSNGRDMSPKEVTTQEVFLPGKLSIGACLLTIPKDLDVCKLNINYELDKCTCLQTNIPKNTCT